MSAINHWDRALAVSWNSDRKRPMQPAQRWDKRKLRRAARQLITRAAVSDPCYANFARFYKR